MPRFAIFVSILAFVALVGSKSVLAANEQFQFKVPVTFDLVPREDVSGSTIWCEVHSGEQFTAASLIGKGKNTNGPSGFINPNKPKFSHDFYVNFDASPGKDPLAATHYQCYLELSNSGQSCKPHESGTPEWCRSNSSDDVLVVRGAIE